MCRGRLKRKKTLVIVGLLQTNPLHFCRFNTSWPPCILSNKKKMEEEKESAQQSMKTEASVILASAVCFSLFVFLWVLSFCLPLND